ncbi:hypothetical protein C8J56DRAFT_1005473 [Mycena floridula]|nr:hypothetical protein C8J56DRAFT_1005473 [Mycena floridula]
MGSSQSKQDEKVSLHSETPIQFSPTLVEQLAQRLDSSEVPPERQSALDTEIRSKIQKQLFHLHKEEEHVRQQIEAALEKENLDRERSMAADDAAAGSVKTSAALLGDLEEIQTKIDRFKSRKDLAHFPAVKEHQDAVIACYQSQPQKTLDCWRQVQKFKASVAQVEQDYFKSLQ